MKAGFLALSVTMAACTPAFAQLMSKPVYPRSAAGFTMIQVLSFASLRDFYASVAEARHLPDPRSDAAIQLIESRASVEHLRDGTEGPIVVVKIEQPELPGQYAFHVMREKDGRLRVLGQMNGVRYDTLTERGLLEFFVAPVTRAPVQRFQVDGEFLINLSDLESLDRSDPVDLDVRHGF